MDPDAAPGDRELRLRSTTGLTNPLLFQVGQFPEIREPDIDNDETTELPPAQPPVVINGQILPGAVDRIPLQLSAGQKLLIAVQARKLIPYLADAVPGWFQAVAALYDPNGKEIAYDDECGFDPDPALTFKVPSDGKYTLEIRDAIYRGREDFIYRVDVCDQSLIKSIFPLGSRGGVELSAAHPDKEYCAKLAALHFGLAQNPMPLCSEIEPNNTRQTAMRITLPHVISGCISDPSDKDVFGFDGRAGQIIVAEVFARRMGSPLDSLLRLIDSSGRVLAWNDDHEDQESGLLTHQADSYLSAKLPAAGRYFLQFRCPASPKAWILLLSEDRPARPDFALRVTPSSLNVPAGRAVTATVYAVRKDGWDGDIDVALKDAPAGFTLSGARIPRRQEQCAHDPDGAARQVQ